MLDKSEIVDYFAASIDRGTRYEDPYLLYTFRPFSEELYAAILANLPHDDAYMELKHGDAKRADGSFARLVFPLKEERIRKMLTGERREFWLEFSNILRDTALRDIFKRAFESELSKRFGVPLAEIPALPVPMLIRDFFQYKINIHHDIDTKVMTTQYYLPGDDTQRHLGTNIYRRTDQGKFELVRKLEFMPRNAYCFAVSKYSWHSVDAMSAGEKPRNSLMLIYFTRPGIDY